MKKIGSLFKKDVILGIKDIFIILEIVFAVVFVSLLLFVIPEDIQSEAAVYIWDQTSLARSFIDAYAADNPEIKESIGEFFVDNRADLIEGMRANTASLGVIIARNADGAYHTELLTQPYTTEAMVKFIELEMRDMLFFLTGSYPPDVFQIVEVTSLQEGLRDELPFNKRILPPVLMVMVGVIGLFAMVSLVGQERSDDTIRAFRVSPAGMWLFLLSKHLTILVTGICTFSILYLPVMGFHGYLPALAIMIATIIIGSSIGAMLGAFYDNPMASMGWVMVIMMIFTLPAISLFAPIFSPDWLRIVPSFHTLFGLDAAMFPDNNAFIIRQSMAVLSGYGAVLYLLSGLVFTRRMWKEG